MFGIAAARLDQITEAEKERYQAFYCGLCRCLKERYGQVSRAALSYDLTFYVMLMQSLQEGAEDTGSARCISHPKKLMPYLSCAATKRAADLSVALAYHKCLDDVADEGGMKAHAARALLHASYRRAQERIPKDCERIARFMDRIARIESAPSPDADAGAAAFGDLLGDLFAQDAGFWAEPMRTFGRALGCLIYLMDAAVDLPEDRKMGAYNPFAALNMTPEELRSILESVALDAAVAFDRLPLEKDAHLLQSVLYSGVWQKFNTVYSHGNASGSKEDDRKPL